MADFIFSEDGTIGQTDGNTSRVGIGKTNPDGTLEVAPLQAADDTIGDDIILTAQEGGPDDSTSGQKGGDIFLTTGDGSDATTTNAAGGNGGNLIISLGSGGTGDGTGLNGNAGRVGIGTTAPLYEVHIETERDVAEAANIRGPVYSKYTYRGDAGGNVLQGSGLMAEVIMETGAAAPRGAVTGVSGTVKVENSGDAGNEATAFFGAVIADEASRLWGFDLGVQGAIDVQMRYLVGVSSVVNNYDDLKPENGGFGAVVLSRPQSGPGFHLKPATTGTGTISSNGTTVDGSITPVSTQFQTELASKMYIIANGETRLVAGVSSQTLLTIDAPFSSDLVSGTTFEYTEAATTYALDAGLAIGGWSGEWDETGGYRDVAFDIALQIGGQIGNWMPSGDNSVVGTGIDISDFREQGIHIHDPQSGGANDYALVTSANAGDVGIGTTTPGERLDVQKTTGQTLINTEVAANSLVGLQITKTGATNQQWQIVDGQSANGTLEIYDASTPRSVMAFDGSGNVGIGDATPSSKLDVANPSSGTTLLLGRASGNPSIEARSDAAGGNLIMESNGGAIFLNNYSTEEVYIASGGGNVGINTTTPGAPLEIQSSGASDAVRVSKSGSTTGIIELSEDASGNGYLDVKDSTGATTIRISGTGNLGIGATSPATPLEIKSTNISTDVVRVTQSHVNNNAIVELSEDASGNGFIDIKDSGGTTNVRFTGGSTTDSYINAGNVGIGDATPSYKLDVNGDINVQTNQVYRHSGTAGVGGNGTKYNIGGGSSGELASITIAGGIITEVTTVP